MSTIQARVPTLPTPTTLRAACDVAIPLEQPAAVGGQGPPVGADDPAHELLELSRLDAGRHVLDRDDQRRVARDPALAVDDLVSFANAFRLSFDRALARLRSNTLPLLAGALLSRQRGDLVDVDARVPEVEVGHRGEAPDRLPVRARRPSG